MPDEGFCGAGAGADALPDPEGGLVGTVGGTDGGGGSVFSGSFGFAAAAPEAGSAVFAGAGVGGGFAVLAAVAPDEAGVTGFRGGFAGAGGAEAAAAGDFADFFGAGGHSSPSVGSDRNSAGAVVLAAEAPVAGASAPPGSGGAGRRRSAS